MQRLTTTWRATAAAVLLLAAPVSLARCGDDDFDVSENGGRGGSPAEGGLGGSDAGGDAQADSGFRPDLCGNGVVDLGEDCDDQNDLAGDGCESDCRFSCEQSPLGDSRCSDGKPCNGDERCGPDHVCVQGTARADGTVCGEDRTCRSGECVPIPEDCGDGIVAGGEQCEDDNDVAGDGCDPDCRYSCWLGAGEQRPCPETVDVCAGFSACNAETHRCDPGTPLGDGSPCEIDGQEAECVGGTCTFRCETNADCDTGNPCRTSECSDHRCTPRVALADGTSCGEDEICISGLCRVTACRDGVFDPLKEECDDGNNIEGDGCDNDCTLSCEEAADCAGAAPVCRAWACENNRCITTPDADQQGDPCTTPPGTATCRNGACTSGTCGNQVVEEGEECDLGTAGNGQNAGCETYCRFSCNTDDDCDNDETCDGVESCETRVTPATVKLCVSGEPIISGAQCGATVEEICIEGVCRVGFCGDGFADSEKGEECDPPSEPACSDTCSANDVCDLSGLWAQKVEVDVNWSGSVVVRGGEGVIHQWALMQVDQSGTSLDIDLTTCGLTIPDFGTTEAFDNETFGIVFPNSLFDTGSIPVVSIEGTAGLSPGSSISTTSAAFQLGVELDSPFGPWPQDRDRITEAERVDHDGDGRKGISARTKTGGNYTNLAVNLDRTGRADRIDLLIRQIVSEVGTITTCDELDGTAHVTSIDNHIIGCHQVTEDRDCVADESALIDSFRPHYVAERATWSAKRLESTATCADVRRALP